MKTKSLVFLPLSLLLFSMCSCNPATTNEDKYLKDPKYSYEGGKVTVTFASSGYKSFNIYHKYRYDDKYQLLIKTVDNEFTSDFYDEDFKIVPIDNDKEVSDKALEVKNYLEGVFDNQNIKIFTPEDSQEEINNFISEKYESLRTQEFTTERVQILFLPGNYSDVTLSLGYYTAINGLGYSPLDCTFKKLEVKNHPNTGNALINFWRTVENVSLKENSQWAISQATSIRRSHFGGDLVLYDSEGGTGYSSGGFIVNSYIEGNINPGTQQQFLMRNDKFNRWNSSNINMVFEGCIGNTPTGNWANNRTTVLENTLEIKEKPYLVFDDEKGYGCIIPHKNQHLYGYSWEHEEDEFVSIEEFYIAHPDRDNDVTINKALDEYKYILFTPGIYNFNKELYVNHDETVITGLGLATLTSASFAIDTLLEVRSVNNNISSLLFQNETDIASFVHLKENEKSSSETLLADLFFRIGGQTREDTSVDISLKIDQDEVIGDNFWIWRADHGRNIGFEKNYARVGIEVNGRGVICHALMVEHFYEYQTLWNGEDGQVIFYQSETPYDAPDQDHWKRSELAGEASYGYPSYKVSPNVNKHTAYGLGVYYVINNGLPLMLYCGFEAPENENIYMLHLSIRHFLGNGAIMHTINSVDGLTSGKDRTVELFDKTTFAI